MPLYSTKTDLSTEEAIKRAIAYFGEGGVGLKLTNQESCCAEFKGGGGHVSVRVASGEKTEVNLETREWDYPVKQFMREIG